MIVTVDLSGVTFKLDGAEVPADTVIRLGGYRNSLAEFKALPPVALEVDERLGGPRLFVDMNVSGAQMVPLEEDLPSLMDLHGLVAPTAEEKAERRRTFWLRPGASERGLPRRKHRRRVGEA